MEILCNAYAKLQRIADMICGNSSNGLKKFSMLKYSIKACIQIIHDVIFQSSIIALFFW